MRRVAIVQSNYIPWKGYFDLINSVDEFILYDDAQYTKRDWRNRNIIKTVAGPKWVTIPIDVKGKFTQKVKDAVIAEKGWAENHWKAFIAGYSRAPYFKTYSEHFESLYLGHDFKHLSEVNFHFIKTINRLLGINTKITWSMDYKMNGDDPSEKLLSLCHETKATDYVSGPLAKDYLQTDLFRKNKINVEFFDYENYLEYNQLYPPFDHKVTVLDLIFNEGPNATQFMKTFIKPVLNLAIGG